MMSKGHWRGRPIEDFTKEELIEIIVELDRFYREWMQDYRKTYEAKYDI